jgi:signal transduction histidine kinase
LRERRFEFSSALLTILAVAAVVCAAINFQQQSKFHLPEDGVIWTDRDAGVKALHVLPGSPAQKAGIRTGDVLHKIDSVDIARAIDVPQVLIRLGAWTKADYLIDRDGVDVKTVVIVGQREVDGSIYYQYLVGAAYLLIGWFVLFRRGSAQKARHFFVLCLASFVLYAFHYTGKLNNFDKVMYWGNVAAGLLAPSIFLHFCLTFPEPRKWVRRGGAILVYLPALLLLAVFAGAGSGTLRVALPPVELRWILDRLWLGFLAAIYLLGGLVLSLEHRKAEDPILRQQLKWLRNGAFLGIVPFTIFNVAPYLMGATPNEYMRMAVLPLALIPLTWAYAVLRYRLMDVDIIFQQGYVYTLATLAVLAIFYGMIFSLGKFEDLSTSAVLALILIAAFIFQPIRNWIQEELDKNYFYKDRYDYRRTLIEFARELSSETDLDAMLGSVAERLIRTLSIQHLAFFLREDHDAGFELRMISGDRSGRPAPAPRSLDLDFLSVESRKPYLFFERTRHPVDVVSRELPLTIRRAIADLDLTYYIPCTVRGRTIAYLGLSRTGKGDFLSSDDIELLLTLSGYVGIAVENARLYTSLQCKVDEYERLKEFSENIVESINVGILAVDLEDRVESWNHPMEALTGVARREAAGMRLADLFAPELNGRFAELRGQTGIHHIYNFTLHPQSRPIGPVPELAGDRVAARAWHDAPNGHGAAKAEFSEDPAARDSIVNIAVAPLISKDEQQIGRLIMFDDITERAELERRLVQADKLSSIGLLAAGVAHEVNTPLAVISTYAQMLAKQVSGEEQKSRLDKIAKQTFRASEIVNSLLNFSRTSPTEFTEVDVNKVIRETLSLIDHQLKKAAVAVRLDLDEALAPVKGDSGKLQQVFLNLFLNARDAMPTGGTLGVTSKAEDGTARVEVADTGHGISRAHLERIFDPFFTTKGGRKGTGLGLSVTYGIVKEHGGAIEAESRPESGTRFHLKFPLARKAVNV